jgi:flavin-dependent dehydrogenase
MPLERRFDVVIAGAGPAGSTLAQRLAAVGFHVALVEHPRFPRFKARGEFMSPECLPMLADLGVADELRALGDRIARGRRVGPVRGVGPLSGDTTRQTFDGAALVRDACGYVDPVTGAGNYFALKGAEMSSESLGAALHARRLDRGALRAYASGRRRELDPRPAFGVPLQRGLRHPREVRAALTLLEARQDLVDVLVSVAGEYVPSREPLRPRAWWRAPRRPLTRGPGDRMSA